MIDPVTDPRPLLGLESGTVRLSPYHSGWVDLFEIEVARITPFLSLEGVVLAFEHIGSTAVAGMTAKPIIDILAGMRDPHSRQTAIKTLQIAGYIHRGHQGIETRNFFRRGVPRQYHLHLTVVESSFWNDQLTFRDALRASSETAEAYARLKIELAGRYPRNREAYIEGKTSFVENVLSRAMLLMGRSATIDGYLRDVAAHFGENTAAIEASSHS